MMGSKSLRQMIEELDQASVKNGVTAQEWTELRLLELQQDPQAKDKERELLERLQKVLARPSGKQGKGRKSQAAPSE